MTVARHPLFTSVGREFVATAKEAADVILTAAPTRRRKCSPHCAVRWTITPSMRRCTHGSSLRWPLPAGRARHFGSTRSSGAPWSRTWEQNLGPTCTPPGSSFSGTCRPTERPAPLWSRLPAGRRRSRLSAATTSQADVTTWRRRSVHRTRPSRRAVHGASAHARAEPLVRHDRGAHGASTAPRTNRPTQSSPPRGEHAGDVADLRPGCRRAPSRTWRIGIPVRRSMAVMRSSPGRMRP